MAWVQEIGWLLFSPALFLFYFDGQNFQIAVRKLVNAEPVILWVDLAIFVFNRCMMLYRF